MQIFDEIKNRGVEDILFISMDGVSGLEEGAKSIFGNVVVQRCIVHMIRNSLISFVKLPKECTTGSSIMPHKKNPDVFELIRAKMNKLQGLPQQITLIMNNLPVGRLFMMSVIC